MDEAAVAGEFVLSPEEQAVSRWRHQQLVRHGMPDPQAALMADLPHVDLHIACDMLDKGCPPMTVWQILV